MKAPMKINVIQKNDFSVQFDMVSDELPEKGEYLLIATNEVDDFVFQYMKNLLSNIVDARTMELKLTQLEQHLYLIDEKVRRLKLRE